MKDVVTVIRGELNWAKIVGKARPYTGNPKYDKGPYWSVDITPDAKSRELLKKYGIDKKLRTPKENDERKESFLSLKVLENRADGTKNDPPKITTLQGQPWDDSLIGNGSIGDIKIKIKDYGAGSEKGVYFQALRVLKHVPYEAQAFAPLSPDDEFFAGAEGSSDTDAEPMETVEDLDDDIPF